MNNFFSKNILSYLLKFSITVITVLIFFLAPSIFKESNVFFYTLSTIVQGFIALVALLGAVVVFKVQLEDQAMQKLSDGVESLVGDHRGYAAKTYTPTQMMKACEGIISKDTSHFFGKDLMTKVLERMKETVTSRDEAKAKMVDFAIISFINVSVALIFLLFTPVLVRLWYIGGVLLTANVYLSIFCLWKALRVIKSSIGFSKVNES